MPTEISVEHANRAWGAVCGKGHIRDVKIDANDLTQEQHCPTCSKPVYRICPHCSVAIPVRKYRREDGSTYWQANDYCKECGNAYPWGPGPIGKWIHRNIPRLEQSQPQPSGQILTHAVQVALLDTKYGNELISHIRDGDKCYRHRLWHPALASYIHAFEWAAITYLETEADLDIIEKELDGVYYNFAAGERNLLDELTEHIEIDQKTLSRIRSMNQAERRWMAHHKSGEIFQDDVDAVRSRLKTFVGMLFESLGEDGQSG